MGCFNFFVVYGNMLLIVIVIDCYCYFVNIIKKFV